MAYREFRDPQGVLWSVWEIQPSSLERRLREDGSQGPETERRRGPPMPRFRPSNPQLAAGWLAFESSLGKWRLCPVPTDWERLSDMELSALQAQATRAPMRRLG